MDDEEYDDPSRQWWGQQGCLALAATSHTKRTMVDNITPKYSKFCSRPANQRQAPAWILNEPGEPPGKSSGD